MRAVANVVIYTAPKIIIETMTLTLITNRSEETVE
jgi:hypothetical protein